MTQWFIQQDVVTLDDDPARGTQLTEDFQVWGPWETRDQASQVAAQLAGDWVVRAEEPLPGQHMCGACGRWFWSEDLDHPHAACYPVGQYPPGAPTRRPHQETTMDDRIYPDPRALRAALDAADGDWTQILSPAQLDRPLPPAHWGGATTLRSWLAAGATRHAASQVWPLVHERAYREKA